MHSRNRPPVAAPVLALATGLCVLLAAGVALSPLDLASQLAGVGAATAGALAFAVAGGPVLAAAGVPALAAADVSALAAADVSALAAAGAPAPAAVDVAAQSFSLDYHPTAQTQHLALFTALTVALSAVGYWILSTRQTRGARLFAATLLLASVRTGFDVLQVLVGELWTLHRALVAGGLLLELFAVLAFLRFAGRYADEPRLYDGTSRTAFLGLAVLATLAVVTNPLHGQVAEVSNETTPFVHAAASVGPLGWAMVAVTLALLLIGAGLLARSFTVAEQPDWWSAAMLTMGICLTVVVVTLDVLGQLPVEGFNYGGAALAGFLSLTTPALLGHGLRRIEITARESMLRELDDPIVIVDDKRHVVDYTAAAEVLLPPGAAGQPFETVLDLVPEWPSVGETTTAEVTRSDIVRGGAASDDEVAHYLMQTSPVTSETGDVIGYTVRFADVTDLKERTAELARKNEQLDQFANTISQDLREPLRVASEYVDMLEAAVESARPGGTLDAETVHHYLETVDRSLERMQHIIDDLLALARDTDPVSEVQPVDFGRAAREAWDLVDPEQGRLRVDGDGTVHADRECLQRVFENLFRTVLETGGSDGDPSTDRAATDVLGGGVEVAVGLDVDGFYCAASGPGLPTDLEDVTLERSDTAAPEQQRLELSIVDHLADAHGWTVSVDADEESVRFDVSGVSTDSGEPIAGEAA